MSDDRDPRTFALIGAAMEVHRRLGHGFLEAVYQEAFAVELRARNLPFAREVQFPIRYRDTVLAPVYRADFVAYDRIIVELKALGRLTGVEEAQTLNYLKASGLTLALLFNFGAPSLEYRRLIFTPAKRPQTAPRETDFPAGDLR